MHFALVLSWQATPDKYTSIHIFFPRIPQSAYPSKSRNTLCPFTQDPEASTTASQTPKKCCLLLPRNHINLTSGSLPNSTLQSLHCTCTFPVGTQLTPPLSVFENWSRRWFTSDETFGLPPPPGCHPLLAINQVRTKLKTLQGYVTPY